ncbi:MAG: ribonuclease P protein component [Deltaproteobacteria bacterium]|nr:ribonuclease P protein component [Deltaproteobacteria bacterium]
MKRGGKEGTVNGAGKDCGAEKKLSFPKGERLLKSQDFTRVRKDGKRLYSRSFTVFILPNALGKRRLGLSVGARVADSPGRNRVKRLIREFYRLNKGSFPDSSDILISVKTVDNIKWYRDLEEEFRKVLRRSP